MRAKWEREESNLHCLPRGNRFTVCCNTTNRYRFPNQATFTKYKVVTIFLLETVKLFHCFPKQEELLLSHQCYFPEFSHLNSNHWSHPSATHWKVATRIRIRMNECFTNLNYIPKQIYSNHLLSK